MARRPLFIDGVPQSQDKLRRYGQKVVDRLKRELLDSARSVLTRQQRTVHVRTGTLKRSFRVGSRKRGEDRTVQTSEVYAPFEEALHPSLRPAAEAEIPRLRFNALRAIQEETGRL